MPIRSPTVAEREALQAALPALPGGIILVSTRSASGWCPKPRSAGCFRDEAGRLNQELAALCERVTFVAAGLPMVLKAP